MWVWRRVVSCMVGSFSLYVGFTACSMRVAAPHAVAVCIWLMILNLLGVNFVKSDISEILTLKTGK